MEQTTGLDGVLDLKSVTMRHKSCVLAQNLPTVAKLQVCVWVSVSESIYKPLALELLHIVNRIVATNQKNLSAKADHIFSQDYLQILI